MLPTDPLLEHVPSFRGYKVLGRCLVFAEVGRGGMGAVYRGRHLTFTYPFDCAVKCLLGAAEIERFEREATLGAELSHENLVRVFDTGSVGGLRYLVMEWIEGESATQLAARHPGGVPVEVAVELCRQACEGLAVVHDRGVVHRDIKPSNLMVSDSGTVKVVDLGIAKRQEAAFNTLSGAVFGTPQFMAPEQFSDSSRVGPPADVFSMGATLYFMLTGTAALQGSMEQCQERLLAQGFPSLADEPRSFPDELVAIVDRATRTDPDERFADARELAAELRRFAPARHSLARERAKDVTVDAGPTREEIAEARATLQQQTPPPPRAPEYDPTVVIKRDAPEPPDGRGKPQERRWAAWMGVAVVLAGAAWGLARFWPGTPETRLAETELDSAAAGEPGSGELTTPHAGTDPNQPGPGQEPPQLGGADLEAGGEESNTTKPVQEQPDLDRGGPASPLAGQDSSSNEAAELESAPEPPPIRAGFAAERFPEQGDDSAPEGWCWVPELEIEVPDLYFVEIPGEHFMLQLTEVTQGQLARLGVDLSGFVKLDDPGLPADNLTFGEATRIVAKLNELRSEGFSGTFVVPTEEQWLAAGRAGGGQRYAFDGTPIGQAAFAQRRKAEEAETEIGSLPSTEARNRHTPAPPAGAFDHPQGSLRFRSLSGNVSELCRLEDDPDGYDAIAKGGSRFDPEDALEIAASAIAQKRLSTDYHDGQGLRLAIELDED